MTPYFAATYSTLCPVALSSLISATYEAENVRCKLLVRGVSDTYLVESSEDKFILRVYRSSHRRLAQITEEIELLLALKRADVSVSYPISDISGKTIQMLEAVEGQRHAVLFSYAPGHTVRILNENQLRIFGREMARFHNVSATIEPGKKRWRFDLQTTLFTPLTLLKSAFAEDNEGYEWLRERATQIEKKFSQLNTFVFSTGYCHFDFLPKNFHFDNDSITFFDFDFMGQGWLVNDIMSFWQHLMLEAYAGRITQQAAHDAYAHFLEGYRALRSVSEYELEVVPYLTIGFWLFYMGFHTTHDQFYAFIQPSQLKLYTGFLKHVVETYWKKEDAINLNN